MSVNEIGMDKLIELRTRMYSVEVLRLLKSMYQYNELSRETGLPPPVLSRYVNGYVLPSLERAKMFIQLFKSVYLKQAAESKIIKRENIIQITPLLSDTRLLSYIAKLISDEFSESGVTKVLTKETDGIPLAVLVGNEFGVPVIVAKNKKELGIDSFIEARQTYVSGVYTYIYVPKNLIRRGDRVLIVDDVIRSGSTIRALINICREVRAEIAGIYALASIGNSIENLRNEYPYPVKSLLIIK
jgi:adenine/guanine phosphoribosyltransferase-like PRPP-binding protein